MSSSLTPAQRVLAILDLLQRRPVWTGPQLAAELGVTTRTIRRDVERLRDLGYPIGADRGDGGGYQLGRGMRMPPLLLDDAEAVAVAVALRVAAGGAVSGLGEACVGVLAKLDQVMPARLRTEVAGLAASIVTVSGEQEAVTADALLTLARAVRTRVRVRFDYTDKTGHAAERHVDPYRIVVLGRRWYLHGYDHDRGDWRTFRLDRMTAPRRTTLTFTPHPGAPDPAATVGEGVAVDQFPLRGSVVIKGSAAELAARFPPTVARIVELRGPTDPRGPACRVTSGAHDWDELAWHLAAADGVIEVEGPAELTAALHRLGRRLAAARGPVPGGVAD